MLIEKGCVVNSLYNYPTNMMFFTTPELLEIGNIPMTSLNEKPNRHEALKYYRRVAEHYKLNIHEYERVDRHRRRGRRVSRYLPPTAWIAIVLIRARKVVLATGYYDVPNLLNVPGEDLGKVLHYYKEPHPYYNHDVAVIGAKNSAAIAALELFWTGARVTLIHRGAGISENVKYWIKPNIENRIKSGEIQAYFNSQVVEILPDSHRRRHSGRRSRPAKRFRLRADRLQPRSQLLECHRDYARSRDAEAAHRPANAGKRAARHLPGGRHRGGHAHQRNLHRERTLPRQADRGIRRRRSYSPETFLR